jgi:hypothetical protein
LIGIAAVGLLLVAGLVIGLATLGGPGDEDDVAQPGDGMAAIDDLPLPGEIADALDDDGGTSPADRPQQIMASITSWREIKKIVTLRDTVRIQILDVWASFSVTGTPRQTVLRSTTPKVEADFAETAAEPYKFVADTVPEAADETTPSPEAEVEAPSPSPSGPRYIFVKVSITNNKPSAALNYSSWNGYGENAAQTAAILADSSGKILEIVPYSRNSDAGRQRFVSIMPAQQITDLLVFEVPQGPIDYVRLALPYAALGVDNARSSHVAYQISRDDLNASPRDKLVRQPGREGDVTASGSRPTDPDEPGIDAIRRGIAESTGDGGQAPAGDSPDAATFENPPLDEPAGGDDSSPFPATGSVGAGDGPPSGFSDEEVPPDIRELIRAEGGAAEGNEEVEPFDDDQIK